MDYRKGSRHYAGVSLVELMATLSIVGILGAVAIPILSSLHRSAARTAAVNDFMHSIFLARSRAIAINNVVSICRSVDGEHCDNRTTTWETGWIVFENKDHDQPADRDAGEPVIYRHDSLATGHVTSNRLSFSFRPVAQSGVTGTLVFCDSSNTSANARAIIISQTGRPRVSQKDASNRPLSCT